MAEEINPIVGRLFDLAQAFAPTFQKQLAAEPTGTQPQRQVSNQTLNEQVAWSRLNGSGPADPSLAIESAPTNLLDFISGTKSVTTGTGSGQQNMLLWMLLILGGAALIFFARR